MDKIVTKDLTEFGYRELEEAGILLQAYSENPSILGDKVEVFFNRNSGCVFLSDEDCNTAMMNEDNLELWHWCPECGTEGFKEDFDTGNNGSDNKCCVEYIKQFEE
jgi:hypothetical protein